MEKIVYVLGAGFSAPLGLPVISNFYEKSKDLYFSDTKKYDYFKKIFNKVYNMSYSKNYFDTDLTNIEEILSILEMKDSVTKATIYRKHFINFIKDVIKYYTPKIKLHKNINECGNLSDYLFNINNSYEDYYGSFVYCLFQFTFYKHRVDLEGRLINEIDVFIDENRSLEYSVITLNYDLVLENYIEFTFSNDKTNLYGFNRPNKTYYKNSPWLIKLHGSIDDNEIVAPTWNKILKTSTVKRQWEKAYELLTNATQIRIIGYSLPLTDSYIKHLLRIAIIESKDRNLKNIDVLCKDSDGTVQDRFEKFITHKNLRFINGNCVDYLSKNYFSNIKVTQKEDKRSGGTVYFLNYHNLELAHKMFFENY